MFKFFRKTFSHGIHPPEYKDATRDKQIRRLPFAERMILPLSQHFGSPSVPIVHEGQEVVRGEPIAKADGYMSVPLHAPATGVIEGIQWTPTARGPKTEAIVMHPFPGASQNVLYGARRSIEHMTQKELIQAVQDTGMVGLGGAGFPTHVKFTAARDSGVDTVLVNGCECEPYLTTDHRIMLEWPETLIKGVEIALKITGAKQAIIGTEDNKIDAVKAVRAHIPKGSPITVHPVQTKYPQGAEKMLIKALLKREVPSGGFPADVGVAVFNVATLAQLGYLLPRTQGLVARVVTITGPGVKKPGNYLLPLGTPLRFVLRQIGYTGGANHLIMGGPMMGATVASLDVPVTKTVGGILVLTEEEEKAEQTGKIYPCIKCGKCVEVCPIHLNPSQLGLLAAKRRYEEMQQKFHLNDCFECGCCSYSCPSGIPLVQYFRIAKAVNRENRTRSVTA